jgi:RHS repeat-associated protein
MLQARTNGLVDYKVGTLVNGTVPVPVTQTGYNLDAVGNWNSKTTDGTTGAELDETPRGNGRQTRSHTEANEITQIVVSNQASVVSHDHTGNLTGDGSQTYQYDENNRIILASSASLAVGSYSYDALGRRISKTTTNATTIFLYDDARIIEERDAGNATVATYTYGNYIDEVLTVTRPAPLGTLYYHQNTLWSVHALTDATGTVVERYTYDAYGTITVLDPSFLPLTSSPLAYFTFTGREWDSESGLYHYRARTYSPTLGRFLSRDSLEYVDGMNLYEYVQNAPVSGLDYSGMKAFRIVGKSFINGFGSDGGLGWRIGLPPPPQVMVLPGGPFAYQYTLYAALPWFANLRLLLFHKGLNAVGLTAPSQPFNQNPITDNKDGLYRLFGLRKVKVCCSGSSIEFIEIASADEDGGSEFNLFGMAKIEGTINTKHSAAVKSDGSISFKLRTWGRPNLLAEPGMQWVAIRTSVNIWHEAVINFTCKNGVPDYHVESFKGSRYPSRRLWINGVESGYREQEGIHNLWNSDASNPFDVIGN